MDSPEHLILFRRTPPALARRALKEFARTLRDQLARGRAFCCLITDDRELRRLNRRFLGRDYATDVLSFPEPRAPRALNVRSPSRPPGPSRLLSSPETSSLGDLAISAQTASRQAIEYGHSVEQEICVLMLHGVLHLLGMDHETGNGRMARTEALWRRKLDLPAGLIERVSA